MKRPKRTTCKFEADTRNVHCQTLGEIRNCMSLIVSVIAVINDIINRKLLLINTRLLHLRMYEKVVQHFVCQSASYNFE
jgi:hypothetical protein